MGIGEVECEHTSKFIEEICKFKMVQRGHQPVATGGVGFTEDRITPTNRRLVVFKSLVVKITLK